MCFQIFILFSSIVIDFHFLLIDFFCIYLQIYIIYEDYLEIIRIFVVEDSDDDYEIVLVD